MKATRWWVSLTPNHQHGLCRIAESISKLYEWTTLPLPADGVSPGSAALLSFCLFICPSCFIDPVFFRLPVFEVELRHPRLSRLVPNPGCWLVTTLYITIALPTSRGISNPQSEHTWWRFDSVAHSLWITPHFGQRPWWLDFLGR
jgi:hypothetical protein